MPFTISHVIAVVPLRRAALPFLPLAVGCMAPDYFYFIPGHYGGNFSHTVCGMFLASLPAACLILLLFRRFLRAPLLLLLPVRHQPLAAELADDARAGSFWAGSAGTVLLLLAGIATHLAWDSFTHLQGTVVQHSSLLRDTMVATPFGPVAAYRCLQYGFSIAGLAALAAWYLWLFRRRQTTGTPAPTSSSTAQLPAPIRRGVRLALCAITALATATIFNLKIKHEGVQGSAWEAVTVGGTTMLAATAVYCLAWHWKNRRARHATETPKH